MWRITLGLIGVLTSAIAGCGGPAAPPPAAAKPAAPVVKQVSLEAGKAAPDAVMAEPASATTVDAISTPASDVPQQEPAATGEESKAQESGGRERIALFTPGGPLIVDVHMMIDGRPHTSPFDELVTKVLEAAGENEEGGRATWEALAANEEFLKTQQPNGPSGASQLKMWVEQYDSNRDGRIQRGESAAWLGRNAGRSVSAFAIRSSRSYVSVPSATSRVWRLLDSDRNGLLSVDEIDSAASKFWLLDANDDRVIDSAELTTLREQLEATGMPTIARDEVARYAAIHIEPDIDADRLEYLLSDLYSPRQPLGPASFSSLAELYKKLDANGDDWLEQLELTDMVTMEPHLELAVEFGGLNGTKQGEARIAVENHVPDVSILASPSSNRVVLSGGVARLIVTAHDFAGAAAPNQGIEPNQIRLMVHDQSDAVFEELDQDADGRLGEREVAASHDHFLARDANGDGELDADELRYSMIVAFLRGEAQQQESFYIPPFVAASRKVGAPSWFIKADFNADGDISRREFLGSLERFDTVDENADGYISREEAEVHDEKAEEKSDG